MKYKNIIFDFGNVIGKFDESSILSLFCDTYFGEVRPSDRDAHFCAPDGYTHRAYRDTCPYGADGLRPTKYSKEDFDILLHAIFKNWQALDEGTIDYNRNIEYTVSLVPAHLEGLVRKFFHSWYRHLTPLYQTWDFIIELKQRQVPIYILSNAPTEFIKHVDFYEIVKEFDGSVFSAAIRMAKPRPEIYRYLFNTYRLKPEECFFLDDKKENIDAAI